MTWKTDLDAVLYAERDALLNSDKRKLTEILVRKEKLLTTLRPERAEPNELEALLAKSRRNQALLDAALSGIRQSTEVLGRFHKQRQVITVYDHVGGRREIQPGAQSSMEKKA
jgi:hypothetical protein